MSKKLWRHSNELDSDHESPSWSAPGKVPVTARLPARPQPTIIFRVESTEAARELAGSLGQRDDNGVAAGADVAVDRAASSSGSALPSALQGRFESSLGADLSSVRVHTGGDSAEAARAVGARAYTVGQDIHFGEGHYDPSSAFGTHLLAHEVAHAVQQGTAPSRQNKLEVSTPQDGAELEADRAADAMVAGQLASVASHAGLSRKVMRDPTPIEVSPIVIVGDPNEAPSLLGGGPAPDLRTPAEKMLPKPVYWDRDTGGEVVGDWAGSPKFVQESLGTLGDPNLNEAQNIAASGKATFTTDWNGAQANWKAVVPEMEQYKTAAADAEKKGLLDLSPGGGDLDKQVEGGTMPGSDTPIGEAFNKDGDVGGKHNYDKKKMNKEERLAIDKAKKEVANKTDDLKTSEGEAKNKQNGLLNAGNELDNAKGELDQVKEEGKKQNLEIQITAMEKSCALIKDFLGAAFSTAGGEGKAGAATAGAEGIAGIINTLYWDSQIAKVQGEIQVINGGLSAISKLKALRGIENAKRNVENGIRDVQAAHRAYNKAMRERSTAFQGLSTLMEAVAKKSGATPKEAAAVGAAVQAVPALEYVVEVTGRIETKIAPPSCSQSSALGNALADGATQSTMSSKVGALSSTKKSMTETNKKWKTRLDKVNAMISGAR